MPHKAYISPEGEVYPSVTEILSGKPKPWLRAWKDKWGVLADRKTKCANDVGTRFHDGAEALVWNEDYETSGRVYKMLYQFDMWREYSGFVPEVTEMHVVSHAYKFAGTLDAVGKCTANLFDPDETVLCDWKTSSGIYDDFALQLVAYAQAYKETTGKTIRKGLIVHVSKDKPHHKLTVKEYKLNKLYLNKFLKRLKEFNEAKA